jgi:EAL domain-containing protein (putative c-di-GMP-specific phosphodiesterase class I)
VGRVDEVLTASGLSPAALVLEVTESVFMDDDRTDPELLQALRGLGPRIFLDDFGTGYSSLSYLRRFPVDGLKIDRSFVDGLGRDADDSAIVSAVAGMAGSLGLTIIAEGVETAAQVAELRRLECQRAQGFHFARPMPPDAFLELVDPRSRERANTMRRACQSTRLPSIR